MRQTVKNRSADIINIDYVSEHMKKVAERTSKEIEPHRWRLNYNKDGKLCLPKKKVGNR